jgi:hypothetical protein
MDGENDPHQPEEYILGMIRGEHVYVPQQGAYQEDPSIAVGEDAGQEGVGEDEHEEDVLLFLNPSCDRMEIETFDDEGQTNTNDE